MPVTGTSFVRFSAPGQYEGYTKKEFDGSSRHSRYVAVSDGTKLAVDWYIPTRGELECTEKLPVVFHYTPYGRIMNGKTAGACYGLPDGLYFDDLGLEGFLDLSLYGYVIVIAEVRGTGASFGCRKTTNSRQEAKDGKDIIDWISVQPFCNGKVGMAGYSYTGQTVLECISMEPKPLKAAFVGMTDFNKYDGWIRGGIPRAFGNDPDIDFGKTPEQIRSRIEELADETVPVDEDTDKKLLKAAISEHINNGSQLSIMRDLNWRDSYLSESGGPHWEVISASSYSKQINGSGVAVYLAGGVFDVFRKESFIMFENIELPKKLLIGPWYHLDQRVDVRWGTEMLRWFDHYLKDIDNGIEKEAPITYRIANYNFDADSVVGTGTGYYCEAQNWDLSKGRSTTLYLSDKTADPDGNGDKKLIDIIQEKESFIEHQDGFCPYFSVESRTVSGISNDQSLVFSSEAISNDLPIIGHPTAIVRFSLKDPGWQKENYDLDFFVSLFDHDSESGKDFLITQGQLRASLRKESEQTGRDELGLPWHRCNVGDNEYLVPGEKYRLLIDLLPTSYSIKAGHRIRLIISNSMQQCYYIGHSIDQKAVDFRKPVVKYYLGGEDASRIILPKIL